jgi:POT family proton-dependent oligopeptide transporter
VLVAAVSGLSLSGALPVAVFAERVFYAVTGIFVAYFVIVIFFVARDRVERQRLTVCFVLCLGAAMFWSGFEQGGSALNLFARDLTDRTIFGTELTAGALQSVNAIFIIIFAPIFGVLWIWLARRNANPSTPLKFALGLLGLAAGFFVLAWGAANASVENTVTPAWLVVTYFLHTCGELCLSPVGLSSVTKLAPRGRVGQMMGVWFVGAALGNLFAGLVAGRLEGLSADALFSNVAMIIGIAGIVALVASPWVRKLMGEVK